MPCAISTTLTAFSTCRKESNSIMLSDAAGVSKTLPAWGLPLYLHKHVVEFQKNKEMSVQDFNLLSLGNKCSWRGFP